MIGFEYSKWFGRDAAEHLVHSLEDISRNAIAGENPIVSVILDGENAWEYYPYNGYYFLNDLYEILEKHPVIRPTTYRDYIGSAGAGDAAILPTLAAGSWVYGTFSTWIGDKDKNQAWDLLCAAKHSYDLVMQSGRLAEEEKAKAERQLASCESSDWFWWLGDYNPPHVVESFDKLFRANLANLYCLLKLPVPASVREPISQVLAAPRNRAVQCGALHNCDGASVLLSAVRSVIAGTSRRTAVIGLSPAGRECSIRAAPPSSAEFRMTERRTCMGFSNGYAQNGTALICVMRSCVR